MTTHDWFEWSNTNIRRVMLYTIEDDPVCADIRNMLIDYDISFEEHDFSEVSNAQNIITAPYMIVCEGLTSSYYYFPEDMIEWIIQQAGEDNGLTNS